MAMTLRTDSAVEDALERLAAEQGISKHEAALRAILRDDAERRLDADSFESYERMLELGVAKEVARAVLPLSTYTKYYWSCNPRSLMHFCGLRNHENAQFEIRQFAAAAESFLERLMPITHAAFLANERRAP